MIRLRPHHLLCTQGYSGKGYSTEFVQNMSAIVHSLRNVPGTRIRLVFGSDSLCAHCPHHTADDLCEAQEKVSRFDRKTVEYFDLHEGEYVYQDLIRAIDTQMTPAMLEEARALAAQRGLDITFREMDAQALDYEDGCFDAVISRNLTWTLPDPERAYDQWFRVLKPGGVLLNFDADYAANVRSRSTQNRRVPADSPYGHVGMTDRLQRENDEITLTMDVGRARPAWDREVLEGIGFADCRVDTRVGRRILGPLDLEHAPMFGIAARKP